METAIVKNGTVINIIVAAPSEVKNLPSDTIAVAVGNNATIGGTYAGGVFTRPPDDPVVRPPKVKSDIEAIRAALVKKGVLSSAEIDAEK